MFFVFYTIFYIFLLYMGPTITAISELLMIPVALLREGYLIYLFLLLIYKISKTGKIRATKENTLIELCIFLALPYVVLTNNISAAIPTFLAFFSGPFIFCCITNLSLSERTKKAFHYFTYITLLFICLLSICLYFVQGKIVTLFPYEVFSHFYLTKHEGMGIGRLRLFGIGFHPTTTGFLMMYFVGLLVFNGRKYFMALINLGFWYLTNTRSAIFGIPAYVFFKSKKFYKVLIIVLGVVGLGFILLLLSRGALHNYLDPSALVHVLHLFVTGPKAMIQHFTGTGLGSVSPYNTVNPVIHLESDLYLYSIQVNFINLFIFLIALMIITYKLCKDKTTQSKFLLFITLTFFLGCIIFPLHSLRFTSNFVWIELALYFSKTDGGKNDVFCTSRYIQWYKICN